MSRMTVGALRTHFADTVSRVAYGGERIILSRNGRDVAALVPVVDLAALEALEDRTDLAAAEKALGEFRRSGERAVSLEGVARELGIELRKK